MNREPNTTHCSWPVETSDSVRECGRRAAYIVWIGNHPYPKCVKHYTKATRIAVEENGFQVESVAA